VFISTHELFAEVCDETRFEKHLVAPLKQLRQVVGDGLFTAHTEEVNWEIAHRTLMPAFGPLPIQGMFPEMHDICSQLVLKWARFGPDHDIDVTSDFTRLTLDTIALCSMDMRFNSFYHDDLHPFVDAMVGALAAANTRALRPDFSDYILRAQRAKFDKDIAYLRDLSKELVARRRKHPSEKKDLLNALLNNKDPKLGVGMTDESIVDNMVTFLVAGHETTSGLLSFLFYELCTSQEAYKRAQQEVDEVIGSGAVTVAHLTKLPYLTACLRETLRLHSTAPAISLKAKKDEVIGGKYAVREGQGINCLLAKIQADPKVWGTDAAEFKPERMLDEHFNKLPAHAWKPFGNGVRGCIGRAFAWQEALLTVALLLQIFNFRKTDPSYKLKVQMALTIKPQDFTMRATMRDPSILERLGAVAVSGEPSSKPTTKVRKSSQAQVEGAGATINILYGSNTGTCESLASSLGSTAKSRGYKANVDTLDNGIQAISADRPTVIITASYEGQPPDNAMKFSNWLNSDESSNLSGGKYAVFGVGNREWVTTYQRQPKLIDEAMTEKGGTRLVSRGIADVCDGDIFNAFDRWTDEFLWPAIDTAFSASGEATTSSSSQALNITIDTESRVKQLRQDVEAAVVQDVKLLTAPGKPAKRHIQLKLPPGTDYKAGDYLTVLPVNPEPSVRRAMARFNLTWDATITIDPSSQSTIPTGRPISAFDVFASYVELGQPATDKQISQVAATIEDEKTRSELTKISKHTSQSKGHSPSLLELLERFPTATYTLGQFLLAVPSMRTRQYSISSSPLVDPSSASLTYSVLDAPSSQKGQRFLGVASNYMARSQPGDHVQVALRPSHAGFHLPADDSKPVLMACAGTGLAPFRAFVEERAVKIKNGKKLGPAILFFGCNGPDEDDLYREEFDAWQKAGAVDVRRAYTFAPERSEGCKFVQHRVWHDRKEMVDLIKNDACMYICGAGVVGAALVETVQKIYVEYKGCGEEEAKKWFEGLRGERYWSDIFS
jgi:cytochrome P450/NADPH-cytochrome P450 reductase